MNIRGRRYGPELTGQCTGTLYTGGRRQGTVTVHTARRQHGAGLTVPVYTEGKRFAAGLQRALTVHCTMYSGGRGFGLERVY